MTSNNSRGNYYKDKTKLYYESLGYTVALTEFVATQVVNGRYIRRKFDVFASDLIAMKKDEIIFCNSKSSITGSRAAAIKDATAKFAEYPFPPQVKLTIAYWEPRKHVEIIEFPLLSTCG